MGCIVAKFSTSWIKKTIFLLKHLWTGNKKDHYNKGYLWNKSAFTRKTFEMLISSKYTISTSLKSSLRIRSFAIKESISLYSSRKSYIPNLRRHRELQCLPSCNGQDLHNNTFHLKIHIHSWVRWITQRASSMFE